MNLPNKIISLKRHISVYNKPKIFGIGANKTGTTSLKAAMEEMGFIVGFERKAEGLIHKWAQRDFKPLVRYCYSAQFFQDVPFSLPYTYVIMDHFFSNSKFILTVRDNSEQWYNSITKFHAKKWGKEGRIPTKEDLQKATYIYEGRPWDSNRILFDTPENEPYNKKKLIEYYETHNRIITEYFRHRPNDLLILNVSDKNAYQELCDFLGVRKKNGNFPWKNKT